MRLFYQGVTGAATVTTSSEDLEFPGLNVLHPHKTRTWKAGGTLTTEYLVLNLGTAQPVSACILFNTNFDGTETNISIQGNDADSWGSPAVDVALTQSGDYLSAAFASATYQYWRVVFTKANASDIRSIGNVYLGGYVDAPRPNFSGTKITTKPRSIVGRSLGGQFYGTERTPYRSWAVPFDNLSEAQASIYRGLKGTVKDVYPFYFQVEPSNVDFDEICYGVLTGDYVENNTGFDGRTLFDVDLKIDEAV